MEDETDLQTLRKTLAQEEAQLREMETALETRAAELGYLHGEYNVNVERVKHFYEPQMRPLRAITYAAAEQQKLIEQVIAWREQRTTIADSVSKDTNSNNNNNNNNNNAEEGEAAAAATAVSAVGGLSLPAVAAGMAKLARQEMLRSYDEFNNCTNEELQMLTQYSCPPDEAIATMKMVMQLRQEEDCSWAAAQVLFSHNYFTGFFRTRSESLMKTRDLLAPRTMYALEAFCAKPEHAVEALYACSGPIGCFGQWLHAMRSHYRVRLITAPYLFAEATPEKMATAQATLQTLIYTPLTELSKEIDGSGNNNNNNTNNDGGGGGGENGKNAPAASTNGAAQETAADKDTASAEAPSADEAEYSALKNKLRTQMTKFSAQDQDTVYTLRIRLHEVIDSAHLARERMDELQRKIDAQVKDVQRRYDGTMLPIHDELEENTEQFLHLITHSAV